MPLTINQLGVVPPPFIIPNLSGKLMLSQDGKTAYSIESGTALTEPGYYFLTTEDNQTFSITSFQISSSSESGFIANVEELKSLLKQALEKGSTSLLFKAPKNLLDADSIQEQILDLIYTYPVLCKANEFELKGSYIDSTSSQNPFVDVTLTLHYPEDYKLISAPYTQISYEKVISILEDILSPEMSAPEREYAILRYLASHTIYSDKINGDYPALTHTLYGALFNGVAVCDGYAGAFNYMMNAVGVPTQIVIGDAKGIFKGQPHAWNIIELDHQHYHVDLTWADQAKFLNFQYINQNDATMKLSHTWETENYPRCIDAYAKPLTNQILVQLSTISPDQLTSVFISLLILVVLFKKMIAHRQNRYK